MLYICLHSDLNGQIIANTLRRVVRTKGVVSAGMWFPLRGSVAERGEGGIDITMASKAPARGPRSTATNGLYQVLIQVIDARS